MESIGREDLDIIVVGAGNAATCAALSARENGVWMRGKGVRFQLGLGRQAFRVGGKFKFWGGLACHIWGGGKELMKALHGRAEREQIAILYETPAVALLHGDNGV